MTGDGDLPARVAAIEAQLVEHDQFRFTRSLQVRRQMWFVITGGLLGLLLVSFRGEVNEATIQDGRYASCQERYAQMADFNSTRQAVGEAIVALSPDAPEAAKSAMRDMMIKSKILPLPDCSLIK